MPVPFTVPPAMPFRLPRMGRCRQVGRTDGDGTAGSAPERHEPVSPVERAHAEKRTGGISEAIQRRVEERQEVGVVKQIIDQEVDVRRCSLLRQDRRGFGDEGPGGQFFGQARQREAHGLGEFPGHREDTHEELPGEERRVVEEVPPGQVLRQRAAGERLTQPIRLACFPRASDGRWCCPGCLVPPARS